VALAGPVSSPALAQGGGTPATPPLASLTASRVLVLPAQEVTGAGDATAWLVRFDSVFTEQLQTGGIGAGWAYAHDAVGYSRRNPTYVADPRAIGAQPLKNERATREGFALPEPFASRIRTLVAIAETRTSVVPVVARLDSTARDGRIARLQITIVDARASRVVWGGTVESRFDGAPLVAADSLARVAARLFVTQ
jgi:hypothetical protein